MHDNGPRAGRAEGVEFVFQVGEELDVDEFGQPFAGHALRVLGPGAPAQVVGQGRLVVFFEKLQLVFAVVEDF